MAYQINRMHQKQYKFIALQSYLKKQEKSQIKNLTLYLKQLEKEEQNNPKLVERKKS